MSHPSGGRLWPEPWAVHADLEADRILHRLAVATARELTPAEEAAKEAVVNHVQEARAACRPGGSRRRRGVRDRWRGASVERAYVHLHAAKVFLVDLLPEEEFTALIPDVSTRLGMTLDRNDPRRVEGERMIAGSTGRARRAAVKQAMETAYDASDEEYVRLRDFRNIIVLAAVVVTVLTGILIALVARWPAAIPLCFDPASTEPLVPGQTAGVVCPSGNGTAPTWGDVIIVAGLGALGGALGALVGIRKLRGTSTPYSVSTALAMLKVPSGAMTTIIGMLLLAGGFVPGLTNLDSQRQILSYALIFGIAQHLVTRVADQRAQQILNSLPSKDPEAKPAPPPVVTTPAEPDTPATAETETTAETTAGTPVPAEPPGDAAPAEEPDDAPPETDDEPPLPPEEAEKLVAGVVPDARAPLEPEAPDEFPEDDGIPEVTDDEAAQTGTDRRG